MAITALQDIEEFRLTEQIRLDSLKTAAERNRMGQFATPPPLALSLARYAHSLTGDQPIRFLDPSIGTGSFFSALQKEFPPATIKGACGIEIDPLFASTATELWTEKGLYVRQGDFTRQSLPDQPFNLVIANPPYVRHHHMSGGDKSRVNSPPPNRRWLRLRLKAGSIGHAADWNA